MADETSEPRASRELTNVFLLLIMLCVGFILGVWAKTQSKNFSYFPIEQSNVRVFPYIGKNQVDLAPNETIFFQIESYEESGRIINRYMLDYWLDPQKPSQVGFVFAFSKPLDLSQFSHIRLKCLLAAPSIWIRVASDPKDMDAIEIRKGNYGLIEMDGEQEISIPFSAFAKTNWKNVSVINFKVDADTTLNIASKRFAVEKVEFEE